MIKLLTNVSEYQCHKKNFVVRVITLNLNFILVPEVQKDKHNSLGSWTSEGINVRFGSWLFYIFVEFRRNCYL